MPKIYSTIQGDMWDLISKKVYDDKRQMTTLLKANPQYKDIVIFSAGIELTCPDVEPVTTSNILPIWRQ